MGPRVTRPAYTKCKHLDLSANTCRGSEIEREIAWVIFDEVHYMQDRERGVVWEETIISLPKETKMVFLSATLSNSTQFAAWISHIRQQPCHVVYTDFRPTPLQHYAFPMGGSGLFLVSTLALLGPAHAFLSLCYLLSCAYRLDIHALASPCRLSVWISAHYLQTCNKRCKLFSPDRL